MSAGWHSLPELLLGAARRFGSAPAIASATETQTYSELFGAALALAGRLEPARGGLVALALPKSPQLVTAWLACWFAGAAFSTLDPGLPTERTRGILERLAPRFVLRGKGGAHCDASGHQEIWVSEASSGTFPHSNIHTTDSGSLAPSDLAYVCWTSGSTGTPKGAMLEHRGLPCVIGDQVRAFELGPSARCLWLLRPAFDASLSDVFSCLLAGAELHFAPELERAFTPRALLTTLRERGITHVDLPPSLLPRIPTDELPESLRCVVIGGEAPDFAAASSWSRRVRLVNVYGPTECSICTSLVAWRPDFDQAYIGEPLSAVEYRIGADDSSDGELWIAGAQLARGYWDAPDLDAQRFTQLAGKRWYRTGDRVVRRPTGLCFVGRVDRQLKWRGQLVAPEEVEAELIASGQCERAHVALRDERLIALVQGPASSERSLRERLAERLPRWMLPTHYIFAEYLPETPTGKLDVAALAPLLEPPARGHSVPPRNLLEVVRAQLGRVDATSSYFAQGGDSLGVLEVLSQCEALGLHLTPEALASSASLSQLQLGAGAHPQEADAAFLDSDARSCLPDVLGAHPRGSKAGGRFTLITGATGFLGSRCLLSLLEIEPQREYAVLVRARDARHARQRLERACDAHLPGAFARLAADRVRCFVGDVASPLLGLSENDYAWLVQHTREVIHGAARVNLVVPYAVLRPANVLGTAQVLRFCREADVERLHHASTLSVFAATDRCPAECTEARELDLSAQVSGGYAQSKWAAERLIELAQGSLPAVSCTRFGLITGDSQTAYAPGSDWLTRVTRALAALGCAPDAELAFDLTPVDFAARAWATLILHAARTGYARYHLRNTSVSLARWASALGDVGRPIEQIPTDMFEARLAAHGSTRQRADIALATTRSLDHRRLEARRGLDLFQATGVRFDCQLAEQILQDWGVRPPGAPQSLLTRYAAYMLQAISCEGARG